MMVILSTYSRAVCSGEGRQCACQYVDLVCTTTSARLQLARTFPRMLSAHRRSLTMLGRSSHLNILSTVSMSFQLLIYLPDWQNFGVVMALLYTWRQVV